MRRGFNRKEKYFIMSIKCFMVRIKHFSFVGFGLTVFKGAELSQFNLF